MVMRLWLPRAGVRGRQGPLVIAPHQARFGGLFYVFYVPQERATVPWCRFYERGVPELAPRSRVGLPRQNGPQHRRPVSVRKPNSPPSQERERICSHRHQQMARRGLISQGAASP